MRKTFGVLVLLFFSIVLCAQEPIHFGERDVYLEPNVKSSIRGTKEQKSSLELGTPTGQKLNVLVQFSSERRDYDALAVKGIELDSYLGSNAYYAQIEPGKHPSDFVGTGLRAVVPVQEEWKYPLSLLQNTPPAWAQQGTQLQMQLTWFPTVDWSKVRDLLNIRGIEYATPTLFARSVLIKGTSKQLRDLATAECVALLAWTKPPQSITNRDAALLSGAAVLQQTFALGGRELLGDGIRVGVWDANVAQHVDYGKRIHVKEFEIGLAASGGHGMHTTGTIAGSGLLNERARGMAPHANVWTWNFNMQSNGKTAAQEMYETYVDEQISLTSNSYGLKLADVCNVAEHLNYTALGDPNLDALAYFVPTLTHVFAAGNDQGECKRPYGHSTNYGKNIISVAAVNSYGQMSEFSSFGPLLDGRLFPIVSARGVGVYSTIPNQSYKPDDGTSMACPAVTGHLALLTQRWKQLHGNVNPYNYFLKALIANTATDAGNIGPDYKFGFGIVDAVAAISAMEKEWYQFDALKQNETVKELMLTIPAGVKEARVMLCWNDPVANKQYKAGELPLVNDLDLIVEKEGKQYFPYTLDYKNPEAVAVATKKNSVDNIEQVVLHNPQPGSYKIVVSGKVRQGKQQSYALVWYFEDSKPALYAPLAGSIFAPGENVYIRTQHFDKEYEVELSTDAGKTYLSLGSCTAYSTFKIPTSTKPTTEAKLRLIDRSGNILVMDGEFAIMSQVQNLVLDDKACETEGWLLKWDAAPHAAKYKILRANLETESYQEIAEVAAPLVQYQLPKKDVSNSEKNIYAVQAVSTENILGPRCIGVLARKAIPLVLTAKNLPYRETFIELPLQNATITPGAHLTVKTQDVPAYLGLPLGSQMLVWNATEQEKNWDKPFERRDNVGIVDICGLDLTEYKESAPIYFRPHFTMTPNINTPGALVRLLVDGRVVKDVLDREMIEGDGDEHDAAWDLSSYKGQKIHLTLELALETVSDVFILVNYSIEKGGSEQDVAVDWVNRPKIKDSERLGVEKVQFKVANKTYEPVTKIPVSVQVDGRVVFTQIVEKLKPYEDKIIDFNYDFTYNAPHKFLVEVRVDLANDMEKTNNVQRFEVYNMGDVLRMPEVAYYSFLGVRFPHVPYITKKVKDSQLFVDGGGSLAPYKPEEQAILQILPRDSNNVVQATFREIALAKDDSLSVYVSNVPADLKVKAKDATYHLTESSQKGKIFVSEADNGGLTFRLVGYNDRPGEGWIAEVREITQPNQWRIKNLKEVAGSATNKSKIEVSIENLLPVSCYNVGLTLYTEKDTARFVIPELQPSGETKYIIPRELDVTPPMRTDIRVVLARDGDKKDNVANLTISHDKIWNGGTIQNPRKLWITSIQTPGQEAKALKSSRAVYYDPSYILPLYKGSQNAILFSFEGTVTTDLLPAQLQLWIDANDDQVYDDKEQYTFALNESDYECWATVDLAKLSSITEGEHRMRVMLSSPEGYKTFKAKGEIPWGHVIDFKTKISGAKSPYERELEITEILDLDTKRGLGMEEIKCNVKNNGLEALSKVKVRYKVNDQTPVEEEIACDLRPHSFETVPLTFTKKADLSAVGKYEITVELVDIDGNEANNRVSKTLYNIAAKSDKLYSLKYVGDKEESLLLPWIGLDITTQTTLEGWWKLDASQRCDLVNSEGLWLASYVGEREVADNTLVVKVGEGGGFASLTPVLQPGKWQHIAVSMHTEGLKEFQTTHMKVYVDGMEVPMRKVSNAGFFFSDILLNVGLKGENAMFRLWKTERTGEEIKNNMFQSVRKSDESLPDECLGEFLFTEGQGRVTAYGIERHGLIQSKRADIWKEISELVSDVVAQGQVIPARHGGANEFTITMPESYSQLDKVKLNFVRGWSGAKVYFKNQEILPDQDFDFSGAQHSISLVAKLEGLFGKKIEQQITVKLEKEPSAACNLIQLSLKTDKNPGLKSDIVLQNPEELIELRVENKSATEVLDPSKVVLVVNSISPNAKLYLGGVEKSVESDILMDLRSPQLLEVRAANGRNLRRYLLRLAYVQSIEWETTKIERKYTNQGLQLSASSSSGLPIVYRSKDPKIATVDKSGKLVTCGIGKTQIVAMQPGNEFYLPATPIEREIEVQRIPLTITMKDAVMGAGEELPELELEYNGLQFEGTEALFETEYRILLDGGKSWIPTMLPLTPGTYTVEPKEKGPVDIDGYTVTRQKGKLIVNPAREAIAVTFIIVDEKGNPLQDVNLQYKNVAGIVKNGDVVALLPDNYTVTLTKEGYTSYQELIAVKGSALEVKATLSKKKHHLQYVTGANGVLQGASSQYVADGGDGETVVAVPSTITHRFKQWSDGNREAARKDMSVHGDLNVTAEFEAFDCKLTYSLAEGGKWVTHNAMQTVTPGNDAATVTVEALAGYVFVGWSDGVKEKSRTDRRVLKDLSVTAFFARAHLLKWTEDFELGEIQIADWDFAKPFEGRGWLFSPVAALPEISSPRGNFLLLDPRNDNARPWYADLWAKSPWFSIADRQATASVEISYARYFKSDFTEGHEVSAVLEYCFEDNGWKKAADITEDFTGALTSYTIPASEMVGHTALRFRWNVTAKSYDIYLAIDNITVHYVPESTDLMLRYIADEHGRVKEQTKTDTYTYLELHTPAGSEGVAVEAVPDAGYVFAGWSDKKETAVRKDKAAITVKALFTLAPKTMYEVVYIAETNGVIEGQNYQKVREGERTTPVSAVPTSGFKFSRWSDGSTENPRIDLATKDMRFQAHFESIEPHYSVELVKEGEGELEIKGYDRSQLKSIKTGTELTVLATPANGWELKSLVAGDVDIKKTSTFKVTANTEVKAIFSKSTAVEDPLLTQIRVTPNPFDELLHIMGVSENGLTYRLLNAQGVVVIKGSLELGETVVETGQLESGLFLLQLTTPSGATMTIKVVKQ
ncbi:MAG: S8 family serine peptidase [Bacteroides sp.]